MEMEIGEGLRIPDVHLDVVGSNLVVMVDATLLAMLVEELNRESKS